MRIKEDCIHTPNCRMFGSCSVNSVVLYKSSLLLLAALLATSLAVAPIESLVMHIYFSDLKEFTRYRTPGNGPGAPAGIPSRSASAPVAAAADPRCWQAVGSRACAARHRSSPPRVAPPPALPVACCLVSSHAAARAAAPPGRPCAEPAQTARRCPASSSWGAARPFADRSTWRVFPMTSVFVYSVSKVLLHPPK